MCIIKGCWKFSDKHFDGWGSGGKLCPDHYEAIKDHLTAKKTHQIDPEYLDDYVRIKCLMIEQDTVLKQIDILANQLEMAAYRNSHELTLDDLDDRFASGKNKRGYIRISRALEYYERLCWFPSCHRIFAGGLTRSDFYWYVGRGMMVKDPGPNYYHGDFTHRLQWHAIMRIITGNFSVPLRKPWNKTPLDLYTSLGKGAAAAANVWGTVLDRDDTSPPDLPAIPVIAKMETFSNPNALHKAVLKRVRGVLGKNLNERFEKRKSIVELANKYIGIWLESLEYNEREAIENAGARPQGFEVAGILYSLKKRRGKPLNIERGFGAFPPWDPKNEPNIQNYYSRLKEHKQKWGLENAEKVAYLLWNREIREESEPLNQPYKNHKSSHGTIYKRVVSPVDGKRGLIFGEKVDDTIERVSSEEIDRRVKQSYNGFDSGIEYSDKFGAFPKSL